MNWKKFKKDNVSLSYTVMLLPHSQKKPIHFKIPVWVFGVLFLFLIVLVGGVLFFAGSSYQLRQVAEEKQRLEVEWQQISRQKLQIEEENRDLKIAREEQEKELEQLEEKTSHTLEKLEELTAREKEIRSQLGLTNVEEQKDTDDISDSDKAIPVGASDSQEAGGAGIVKKNLDILTSGMEEQAVVYDDLSGRIANYKKDARRKSVTDYALQFVGNAYVYGGNNPNTGVDCSGFTRYIMSHAAGISLQRTASSQALEGKQITLGEAKPGDLVFYGGRDYIDHVAIYIGDGKVVHASNPSVGITVSGVSYRQPLKVLNVLGE